MQTLAAIGVQATLEEVCEADLLLHVLDASSPDVQQQRSAVLHVSGTFCMVRKDKSVRLGQLHYISA